MLSLLPPVGFLLDKNRVFCTIPITLIYRVLTKYKSVFTFSMNIQPLGGRVVLRLLQKEEVTKSGIVLPDTVDKEKKSEGEVVAVGPGKLLKDGSRAPMEVSVGQKVLVKSWGGDEVEIDGEDYKIFDAQDILAVIQ